MIERFAVPDQLTYYYDRPAEPANMHVEVPVSGGLDERVAPESVQTAVAAEFAARYAKALDQLTESQAGRR